MNKKKVPRYPIDDKYYSEQQIEGIDIVTDCYATQEKASENKPLYLVDGREVTEKIIAEIKPDDVESINVLKDLSATKKYGEKGKNGVMEIFLKKK